MLNNYYYSTIKVKAVACLRSITALNYLHSVKLVLRSILESFAKLSNVCCITWCMQIGLYVLTQLSYQCLPNPLSPMLASKADAFAIY